MSLKSLDELTEDDFYDIACSQGWKSTWEYDRGQLEVERWELVQRGEEIIEWMTGGDEFDTRWVKVERLNKWLEENKFIKFS